MISILLAARICFPGIEWTGNNHPALVARCILLLLICPQASHGSSERRSRYCERVFERINTRCECRGLAAVESGAWKKRESVLGTYTGDVSLLSASRAVRGVDE